MYILSILIPTIPERVERFTALYNELMIQKHDIDTLHPSLGEVEILVNSQPRFLAGGPSIGKKREDLVYNSNGKYLCFCDDDEDIAPNYLESLLRMCREDADVCTFRAMVKVKGYWGLVDMRLIYKVNDQMSPDYTVRRPPWHICAVRSVYAKMFPFQDLNNAEDFEWMDKVLSCCTTEIHTDKILYCYNHGDSEADRIPLP